MQKEYCEVIAWVILILSKNETPSELPRFAREGDTPLPHPPPTAAVRPWISGFATVARPPTVHTARTPLLYTVEPRLSGPRLSRTSIIWFRAARAIRLIRTHINYTIHLNRITQFA